ncbi:MAG: dihydrofolate reductase family protein [bacterium]
MRKLILRMSISVDAFVSGLNGENDWIFSSMDEGSGEWTLQTMRATGLHIMGAKTFRDMASHWPYSTEIYAPLMNEIPKVVFSHDTSITSHLSRETAETKEANTVKDTGNAPPLDAATIAKNERTWKEARVMSGALANDIAQLKSEPGKDIVAWGGAGFARSLVKLGLPDEYRLLVHPIALGSGLPIFSELPKSMALKLLHAKAFDKGTVGHVYQPASSPSK